MSVDHPISFCPAVGAPGHAAEKPKTKQEFWLRARLNYYGVYAQCSPGRASDKHKAHIDDVCSGASKQRPCSCRLVTRCRKVYGWQRRVAGGARVFLQRHTCAGNAVQSRKLLPVHSYGRIKCVSKTVVKAEMSGHFGGWRIENDQCVGQSECKSRGCFVLVTWVSSHNEASLANETQFRTQSVYRLLISYK